MNAFQRKSLYAALASVGALGATTTAQAVNVNPDGLGQVLLYPYYTVNTDSAGRQYNSLLSVVNSTASAKVVKVRFLEGKNSVEVADFNLFLSPYDVWTAAIVPSPVSTGARMLVFDKSCTVPPFEVTQGGPGFVDFVNFGYTGNGDDKGGSGLDRTREGYVEIIEMGTFPSGSKETVAAAVTHKAGVPKCTPSVIGSNNPGVPTDVLNEIRDNSGGLFGGMTLINVGAGTDYTEDAVALDNFAFGGRSFVTGPGNVEPNLQFAAPPTSQVLAQGNVYTSFWAGGDANPVSAVLIHDHVMNEYVLDAATKSGTDWVVTFPTKRFYLAGGSHTGKAQGGLFQSNFNDSAGSCDDISLNIWDREERTTSTPVTISPPPPTPGNSICWEANVITFNNSNVLASFNSANINIGFEHGWMNLGFFPQSVQGVFGNTGQLVHTLVSTDTSITDIQGSTTTGHTVTYMGLPVIGFMVESFINGTQVIGGVNVLANYGGNFVHKTQTCISPNICAARDEQAP